MSKNMKMKCKKVKRLLSRTLDGEITPELKGKVDAHILVCSGCRKEFKELQALKALLSLAPVPEMSPYLFTRTVARLKESEVLSVSRWRVLVWRTAAALLVAIAIAVGVLLGTGIRSNGGANGELATLNAEPSIEELFAVENSGMKGGN